MDKTCTICKQTKSKDYFLFHIRRCNECMEIEKQNKQKCSICQEIKTKDGNFEKYRTFCLECKNAKDAPGKKFYAKKNSEKLRKYRKIYRRNNLKKALFHHAKARAKKRKLDFNIEESDIIIPEFCPILGTKLECSDEYSCNNSPTLDRVNIKKGYIKGNVAVISKRANFLKNDATIEELEKIINYIKKFD